MIGNELTMTIVSHDTKLAKSINRYKHHYLNKNLEKLDESSTRIIVNHLLSDVLGYRELIDIKTEYPIRGGYIDYLIEINHRKKFVIEVKSISTKLSAKHLRQAIYYGAITGTEWIILTNGRSIELHKIRYTKPLQVIKYASIDLKYLDVNSRHSLSLLTKPSVIKGELDQIKI